VRINADDPTVTTTVMVSMAGGTTSFQGVAVDADGKVWGIGGSDTANIIQPGAGLNDAVVQPEPVRGLLSPYTYSDMTGIQQRLAATDEPGTYRQVFEGCAEGPTFWSDFSFEAETPAGSHVVFLARGANTIAELESASWLPLAGAPSGGSDASLLRTLMISGAAEAKYVEIQIELYVDPGASDKCASSTTQSPKVAGFELSYACKPEDPGGPE